jgi:hypothetical protein
VTGGRLVGGLVTGAVVLGRLVTAERDVGLEVMLDDDGAARPDPLLQAPQITTSTRPEK